MLRRLELMIHFEGNINEINKKDSKVSLVCCDIPSNEVPFVTAVEILKNDQIFFAIPCLFKVCT